MIRRKIKWAKDQSTVELMGIQDITEYSVCTKMGDLVFFIIKPTNISVLPDTSVSARIHALLNVIKGQADVEMLAMNGAESFESNKNYYKGRLESEELPVIRKLLEQDCTHLDQVQILTASAREFYIMIRLHNIKETDILPYLSRIEKSIRDSGFITHRADEQALMKMLGVYYEQNVTTEHFDRYDGERWVTIDV